MQKIKYGACALAAASMVSLTAAAQAADAGPGLYGRLSIGPSLMQDMNFAEASTANLALDPETGFAVNGAVGYRVNDGLRLEFDLGYTRGDLGGAFQQNVQALVPCGEIEGNPCLGPDVDGDARTLSGFAMAYYDLPVTGALRPFVGAGVGLLEADLNVGTRATMNAGTVSRFEIINGSDTLMGYRGSAGVTYAMKAVDITFGYTYTLSERMKIPGRGALVNFDFDRRMKAHTFSAGVSYNF